MTLNSRFSHTTSEGSGASPTLRACRFLPSSSQSQKMLKRGMRWSAGQGTAGQGRAKQGRAGPGRAEKDLSGQGTFRRARPCPGEQNQTIAQEESGQKHGIKYKKKQDCQS